MFLCVHVYKFQMHRCQIYRWNCIYSNIWCWHVHLIWKLPHGFMTTRSKYE